MFLSYKKVPRPFIPKRMSSPSTQIETTTNLSWGNKLFNGYYKKNGFILVLTVFRNINVPGLNDSYYVGLSIYNTVICCVVAVPLSFLTASSIGVTFALVSVFLLFCITASLCMLFFPKVRTYHLPNIRLDRTVILRCIKLFQRYPKQVHNKS